VRRLVAARILQLAVTMIKITMQIRGNRKRERERERESAQASGRKMHALLRGMVVNIF
jgi:hypothetical protein